MIHFVSFQGVSTIDHGERRTRKTEKISLLFAGHEIEQLRLENITIEIGKWSQYPGGLLDYRPGYRGLVPHRTVGVFVEHVAQVVFKSVKIEWGSQPQLDWGMLIDMTPGTVKEVVFDGFSSSQPSASDPSRNRRGNQGEVSVIKFS